MSMKRLLLFSMVWWMVCAVEVGTVGAIPALALRVEHGFVLTAVGVVVHFALLVCISVALALVYLRRYSQERGSTVPLAVSTVLTGLALDALVTVPLFVR